MKTKYEEISSKSVEFKLVFLSLSLRHEIFPATSAHDQVRVRVPETNHEVKVEPLMRALKTSLRTYNMPIPKIKDVLMQDGI